MPSSPEAGRLVPPWEVVRHGSRNHRSKLTQGGFSPGSTRPRIRSSGPEEEGLSEPRRTCRATYSIPSSWHWRDFGGNRV